MGMDKQKPAVPVSLVLLLMSWTLLVVPSTTVAQLLPVVFSNHTQVFIVHVQHPKTPAHLLAGEERDRWYHSYLPNTTLDSGDPRMVFTYALAISGFAARLTAEEARALECRDGFVLAHPAGIQPLHTTYTYDFLGLNRFNGLWEHSNLGEGVIIAVLDGGIRPLHPSFADAHALPPPPLKWRGRCDLPQGWGWCNNKLIGAQDFVGSSPSDRSIDDTGHGMHVAGIAAGSLVKNANLNGLASGTAAGMAPRAHLAVYKACKSGGCLESAMLKGIDQAILDGVDIIQISSGQPTPMHDSNTAKGSFRALDSGILTVCSAGNLGPAPGIISNDAPWILTVGAVTTGRRNTVVLKLGNGMEFSGASGRRADLPGVANAPLIYPVDEQQLSCSSLDFNGRNVSGKIVICDLIPESEPLGQSWIVRKAGGAGIIILNQMKHGDTLPSVPYNIPGMLVTHKDALKIVSYVSTDTNPTATIASTTGTEFGVRPSPTVAAFSSRGPSSLNGGILKPDVAAPGVDILSAFHVDPNTRKRKSDAFDFQSGTSMAAPHVSGIAACLMKLHPDWSPAMIKSALMTTAHTEDRDANRIEDDGREDRSPANAFALGAGLVNPSAAEDPGLVYDTRIDDYIPYLCGLRGMTVKSVVAITSRPGVSCSQKMEAEQLNYPSIQVSMGSAAPAMTKTIHRTVKNVGNAVSVYDAAIVHPEGVAVDVRPQTLRFSSVGEEQSFAVEMTLTGSPPAGERDVREGRLTWASGNYRVVTPIVVTQ